MVVASTCSSSPGRKTNERLEVESWKKEEVVVKQEEQARRCCLLRVKGSKWFGSRPRFMEIS